MEEIIGGNIFKSTSWWKSLVSAFLLLTLSHCADQPISENTTQIFPTALEEEQCLNPIATDTLVSWEWIVPMTNKELSPKEQKRLHKEEKGQERKKKIQKIKADFSQLFKNLQKAPVIVNEDTINIPSLQNVSY